MSPSVFTLIHQNQTLISCGISITISICTFVSTILTVDEVKESEKYAGFVIYKKGLEDGIFKTPKIQVDEVWNDEQVQLYSQLVMIRKITTALGFAISFLHLTSSAWVIYKKSKMSIQVWLVIQVMSLAALGTALFLSMMYKTQSVLMLKIFYAVISVDIFLTLVLLLVVFLDLRSGQNFVPDPDKVSVDLESEKLTSQKNDSNTSKVVIKLEEEPLPLPPPSPKASR